MVSTKMGFSGGPIPSLPTEPSGFFTQPSSFPPRPSITLPALPPKSGGVAAADSSTSAGVSFPAGTGTGTGAAAPAPASHLTLIVILSVFVTVTALALVWLFVYLIRRQKQQMRLLHKSPPPSSSTNFDAGIIAASRRWSKGAGAALAQSPINPLRRWLKDSTAFRRFTYSEIQKATDDFSSVIGKGGFGTVYKARFDGGMVAAVKRMNRISRQRDKEFCKEMEFLGRLHHRHLVTLMGFCITRTERFLVYEFMENGSLSEHLQGGDSKSPLGWQTRIQIAIDVAAALEYLHFFSDPPLCHRDIKSSNILLDGNFVAKVADFGLAHPTPSSSAPSCGSFGMDQTSTDVRGTPGYLDPEYVVTQQLTEKSDIYSYGVLLLELVTGRGAVQDKCNLVAWAQPYLSCASDQQQQQQNSNAADNYNKNKNNDKQLQLLLAMADPVLLPQLCSQKQLTGQLRSMARLIRMCTARDSHARPTIRQVLSFLYTRFENPNLNPNNTNNITNPNFSPYLLKPDHVQCLLTNNNPPPPDCCGMMSAISPNASSYPAPPCSSQLKLPYSPPPRGRRPDDDAEV